MTLIWHVPSSWMAHRSAGHLSAAYAAHGTADTVGKHPRVWEASVHAQRFVHVERTEQIASEVGVHPAVSKKSSAAQSVQLRHVRSVFRVGGVTSNWDIRHVLTGRHVTSEVGVAAAARYVFGVQLVTGAHVRSEVGVAEEDSYDCGKAHLVRGRHRRSLLVVHVPTSYCVLEHCVHALHVASVLAVHAADMCCSGGHVVVQLRHVPGCVGLQGGSAYCAALHVLQGEQTRALLAVHATLSYDSKPSQGAGHARHVRSVVAVHDAIS